VWSMLEIISFSMVVCSHDPEHILRNQNTFAEVISERLIKSM
jgi:hypothetical protein